MLEPENELVPDLEWMLSSVQATPAMIVETAAQEYGVQIYCLASAALGDRQQARGVLEDTLLSLVKQRHAYQSNMDLRKWILAQALDICRARLLETSVTQSALLDSFATSERALWQTFYSLPLEERLLLAMYVLLGIEINQAAGLLRINPGIARQRMQSAAEQLMGQSLPGAGVLPPVLAQRLRASFPALNEVQVDEAIAGALRRLEQSARRRRLLIMLQPAAVILLIVAFVLLENWWTRQASLPAATPPAATPTLLPGYFFSAPPELTVWQALPGYLSGRQPGKLWLEALTYTYGPPGYIGPPHVWRNQLWLQYDFSTMADNLLQGLVLSGPVEQPDSVAAIQGSELSLLDLTNQTARHLPAGQTEFTNPAWGTNPAVSGSPGDPRALSNQLGEPLLEILSGQSLFTSEGQLRLVGRERKLERELQIIERAPQHAGSSGQPVVQRGWVDEESGLVLRWQLYSLGEPPVLLQEMFVQTLLLGIDQELPDLDAGLLTAETLTWETLLPPGAGTPPDDAFNPAPPRARLTTHIPPPQGADLTQAILTAQWPEQGSPGGVEIYAGGYYMGSIEASAQRLPSAFEITCRRSPDGRRVAFSRNLPGSLFFADEGLSWFDLTTVSPGQPLEIHALQPQQTRLGRDFAWSPDGNRLAYWACSSDAQTCRVLLFDPDTQQSLTLADARYGAVNFTWHPSGDRLAFVRLEADLFTTPRLWVMDASHSRLLQESAYRWRFPVALDSPSGVWWLPPYQPIGLEGCVGE